MPCTSTTHPAKIDLNNKSLPRQKSHASNSYFLHGRIFISYFSEPLCINSEVLNTLGYLINVQDGINVQVGKNLKIFEILET